MRSAASRAAVRARESAADALVLACEGFAPGPFDRLTLKAAFRPAVDDKFTELVNLLGKAK